MSLIRQSDVKNHLSTRWRKGRRPFPFESQPEPAGLPEAETVIIVAERSEFAQDFLGEHSSLGIHIVPGAHPVRSQEAHSPDAPRNPQE